jgi:hypothetical protein
LFVVKRRIDDFQIGIHFELIGTVADLARNKRAAPGSGAQTQ